MSAEYIIQAQGLKKHYNVGEIKALDGVTASVGRGEVVVVIGPSGSGKSTFLRCLNLLEVPTEGKILFEGYHGQKRRYQSPPAENGHGFPAF